MNIKKMIKVFVTGMIFALILAGGWSMVAIYFQISETASTLGGLALGGLSMGLAISIYRYRYGN